MKKRIISLLCVVLLLIGTNGVTALADSGDNKGIYFIGNISNANKYFEKDYIQAEDFTVDGYCADGEGIIINDSEYRMFLPTVARIDSQGYLISGEKGSCSGTIDMEILPFDSTVINNAFLIPSVIIYGSINSQEIKSLATNQIIKHYDDFDFRNAIGNKIKGAFDKIIIDTTNMQTGSEGYTVPYTIIFYNSNMNKKNQYDSFSGTMEFTFSTFGKKIPVVETAPEEPTTPSLTATSVLLDTMATYDINLVNREVGSEYLWTSSDTEIVEVNSKSGKLKAIKEGKANIICEITLPDTTTQTLVSEVTVGYDANAPLLTESELDLEVGDTFDINLENKVAKSKYRWITSDKSIAKVNSSNGKVTAMSAGDAYVTCTITTPENQVIVLRCDISVTVPAVVTE